MPAGVVAQTSVSNWEFSGIGDVTSFLLNPAHRREKTQSDQSRHKGIIREKGNQGKATNFVLHFEIFLPNCFEKLMQVASRKSLALYPGAEEGEESAWFTLFAHVPNCRKGHVAE